MNLILKKFNELTLEELYQILQLRNMVFIVEQNCPYQDLDDKDQSGHHLLAFENNRLIAVSRILPPGISYEKYSSIGRIVSHPEYRRTGIGKLITKESIFHCERLYPNASIKISAQSYLLPFYSSMGFEAVGKEYLEDNIPHTAMIKVRELSWQP